jgi:hypothetical protein
LVSIIKVESEPFNAFVSRSAVGVSIAKRYDMA